MRPICMSRQVVDNPLISFAILLTIPNWYIIGITNSLLFSTNPACAMCIVGSYNSPLHRNDTLSRQKNSYSPATRLLVLVYWCSVFINQSMEMFFSVFTRCSSIDIEFHDSTRKTIHRISTSNSKCMRNHIVHFFISDLAEPNFTSFGFHHEV